MSNLFFEGFYSTSICCFSIIYCSFLGVILKKTGMVTKSFQNSLSKIVSKICFPCFIFIQILRGFTIDKWNIFLESLLGCSINYFGSYFIAYFLMLLFGYNKKQSRFVGALFSSPHTVSIPVTLIPFIAPIMDRISKPSPGLPASSELRGFLYIIPNSIWSNIWRWSGVNYLVEPENPDQSKEKEEKFSWSKFLKNVINMPIIASVVSIILVLIPGVQSTLNNPKSWLNHSLMDAALLAGHAYSFLVILTLGLSMSDFFTMHPDPEVLSKVFFKKYDIVWFSIIKLILTPIIFTPIYILIFQYWLKSDDLALFLFILLAAAPTAINMILVTSLKGAYEETVSIFMVVQYTLSIITLTITVPIILYMIEAI